MRLWLSGLFLLSSGCALHHLATQKRAWSESTGVLQVAGLEGDTEIIRDELGVPHIRALNEADALFGLGLVHAQDRLFQADLTRRLVSGRLSEFLGARSVDLDAFVLGLELPRRASEALEAMSAEERERVDAYVRGFNQGIDGYGTLPIEYRLLGVDSVSPWTAEDCLSSAFLQSWNLSENSRSELSLMQMEGSDWALRDELMKFASQTGPIDSQWPERASELSLGAFTPGWIAWTGTLGGGVDASQASNNWVIGPERSGDGKPIVANDPHLVQSVPSLWYAADIAGGDLHVAGVTFPGTPVVIIGHNERVAWGLTNVMADYVDFAVYERSGDQAYRYGDEERPLRAVEVQIEVKGAEPETRTLYWTDEGPVITDVSSEQFLVLRWNALELVDESGTGFSQLNRARSVEDALQAMQRPMVVAQNLVVADVDGDFAWQVVGGIPRRRAHKGRVPYLGSDPEQGWDGFLTNLPGERAPEKGYVANANQRPDLEWSEFPPAEPEPDDAASESEAPPEALDSEASPAEPIESAPGEAEASAPGPRSAVMDDISSGWVPPWRFGTLVEALESRSDWSPEAVQELQLNVTDRQAVQLLPGLLKGVSPQSESGQKCLDILQAWDFEASVDSVGPTVWAEFQEQLLREVLQSSLSERDLWLYFRAHSPSRNALGLGIERFTDDRVGAVEASLEHTCDHLDAAWGSDTTGWVWGSVHPLQLQHPFAGSSKLLSGWNSPQVPYPGNGSTVAAAGIGWGDRKPVGGMASVRVVMPLSDLGASTLVYPGGQSGFPKHPDAWSHWDAFVAGQTLPLYFDDEDVQEHTASVLRLVPAP